MPKEILFKPGNYRLIYVFRINDAHHADCLKVGMATYHNDSEANDPLTLEANYNELNEAAHKRIGEYTQTASIAYDLLHTELAVFRKADDRLYSFTDTDVHKVLLRSGIKRKQFAHLDNAQGVEWFCCDLPTIKNAIRAVREGRAALEGVEVTADPFVPIVFRPEQEEAIARTVKQYKKGTKMLWDAKMRFGKTVSALEVVRRSHFKRTLILTHRPVVDDGWFDDFHKIFHDDPQGYQYGSKLKGEELGKMLNDNQNCNSPFVYFASMQDLRGSDAVGGKYDINDTIFATLCDLGIIDEALECTQTALGQNVLEALLTKKDTHALYLSGTGYNIFDQFTSDETYTWDYVMEQRAKVNWDLLHFGDPNPYASQPRMNSYTYNLGALMREYIDDEIAFNFREFFRVNTDSCGNETFVHEKDVLSFLNLMTKTDDESLYPFSNELYRDTFRHTLWIMPGVRSARVMSNLLRRHEVFGHFTVVNVAGEGDREEEHTDALQMVKKAITDHPEDTRTITLSCGRLTTGVSVPAWTGVFMLSGSVHTEAKSFMQTIFRVQTPATIGGRVKEDCYVFDFAPDRTLRLFAEVQKIQTRAGKTTNTDRQTLGEFLNFFPIIAVEGSTMKQFDTDNMLQQIKRAQIERVVRSGFEDQNLYNDELLKLDDVELGEFNDLKQIIGQTKAINSGGEILVNNQGLTDEAHVAPEPPESPDKNGKNEPSPEELAKKKELKEKMKQKQTAISILRGISIRMPLLIYGAEIKDEDKQLTIDNFADLIDQQSWDEFMPRGVTKQIFRKFKRYYDPDVFSAAGKRIRALTRATDHLTIEERIERIADIFAHFRNPDKETVLTPWRVVNMHLSDTIGGYCFYDEDFKELLPEPRRTDREPITSEVFTDTAVLLEINS